MANSRKVRRKPRYDRLFGAVGILLSLILLVFGIFRCIRNAKENKAAQATGNTVENITVTNKAANAEAEKNYPRVSVDTAKIHSGHMILVNRAFPCLIDDNAVQEGTSSEIQFVTIKSILDAKTDIKSYTAADWEVGLDKVAALAMDSWFEEFFHETKIRDLRMISGYKPVSDDPDFETGRTLTIGVFPAVGSSYPYKAEGENAWLAEHAAEYGFILRYPEGKEEYFDKTITDRRTATFRYVGIAPAEYMKRRKICLEEFLQEIRQYSVSNMLTVTSGAKSYGLYYVPADMNSETTSVPVPSNHSSYDISGNNMDGFIVTVYQ